MQNANPLTSVGHAESRLDECRHALKLPRHRLPLECQSLGRVRGRLPLALLDETLQFGFAITGTTGPVAVVEASTNLTAWSPLATNTLTGGSAYFSDSQWINYRARFCRLRWP